MSQQIAPPLRTKKPFLQRLMTQRQLLLMSIPLIIYVIVFCYVPLWGWTMAFQDFKPARSFFQQEWVGLKWFNFIFTDSAFLRVLRNTLAMSLINMALGYVTAITLALMLNEVKNMGFKRVVQTVTYLPHFLSGVIVAGLVATMLATENGAVNDVLMALRIIKEPILWMGEPKYFWGIIGVSFVWKEVGWNTIIYLATMSAIDPTLYEAAEIDGCNRYRKMWHITLPGIKSTIIILLILSIGRLLEAGFEMQYLLRNGLISDVSDTIDIYVLVYGLRSSNFSMATAAGMFKNVVNIVLLFSANRLAKVMGQERLL